MSLIKSRHEAVEDTKAVHRLPYRKAGLTFWHSTSVNGIDWKMPEKIYETQNYAAQLSTAYFKGRMVSVVAESRLTYSPDPSHVKLILLNEDEDDVWKSYEIGNFMTSYATTLSNIGNSRLLFL